MKIMKTTSLNNIARKFFAGSLLAATLFLSAQAAVPTRTISNDKVEVKYAGLDKYNQLTFNVKYNNESGSTFSFSVLDENGEPLFKNFYGDKTFDKTFKLPKSEVSKLTFVIEDGKSSFKQKVDINIQTKVVEDVVITKAN
jgi:hypothetical protein